LSQSLLKVKLQTLNFVQSLLNEPEMVEEQLQKSSYSLVSLVSYAIQNLSIELEAKQDNTQNVLRVFNHWLGEFKQCIKQLKQLFTD
jgi:hypothetical protein